MLNFKEKNGVELKSVVDLYSHILNNCKSLDLVGVMTIGSVEQSINESGINNDFKVVKFLFTFF
jgi:uncharacterized pyridoxal phosphate-containing UPF0001 family protein